ncbi:MAG TPA: OmpA family protein [Paenirhodobacter sp.]
MTHAQISPWVVLMVLMFTAGCGTGPVGEEIDDFGSSTTNNTALMTGERDFAINLTRKFAAETANTVNFAFNSAVLDGMAQQALQRQAAWIRNYPQVRFRVYGHTDLVGSAAYNKGLGLRRAQTAVAFLIANGVSRSQLEAVVSEGKTQPLVFTPGPNAQNRRTVTEVIGVLRRTPTQLDGKYAARISQGYIDSAAARPQNSVSNQSTAGAGTSPGG